MSDSLKSLIQSGTKLWLDSIDPELLQSNRQWGASGATSNPIIVADLIRSGRYDSQMAELIAAGHSAEQIAWSLTDAMVEIAEQVFADVWQQTSGNDGYVSFELDPLIEDPDWGLAHDDRVRRYGELARQWASGHPNRMIKVPATEAGLAAVEDMVAAGISVNVTLIFTARQYQAARDAVWRGAQRRESLEHFKSVYSIFVSRIDVYTQQHNPELSTASQGQVGIVNAKRIWAENDEFWADKNCPLQQEIIFASTGTKNADDPPWKYVAALAGSDIQTNPPGTNDAVAHSGQHFGRQVDQLPGSQVLAEIYGTVDFEHLESTLMREGVEKFCQPQKQLLDLIRQRQQERQTASP